MVSESFSFLNFLGKGILIYLVVILILRISGKRTLSKMNSFDFIVTVALGSILANTITAEGPSIVEGLLAFFLLVFFQLITTWLSVNFNFFNKIIKSSPKLLYYDEIYYEKEMKKERIHKSEIFQAVRSQGKESMEDIRAVVLETDGTFSIIEKSKGEKSQTAMENVER